MTKLPKDPWDLRKVLREIKDIEIDPDAEISGVYRYIGAGGTVERPPKEGPTMMFNNLKVFPNTRVLIGLMASRK